MKLRVKILPGLVLAALMGCLLAFLPHTSAKRAVEKYKRDLRAKGEKLSYLELLPAISPQTPDAAKAFIVTNSVFVSITNTVPMMRVIAPGRVLISSQQETLAGYDSTNVWPGLMAEVEANGHELLKLREILQSPALYYNLDYSRGMGLLLPHLARLKAAEQLAAYSTMVALHEHNFPEAWTNLISSVTLVEIYQAEPLEISHLVKLAMARIALATTWEALQCGQWTDEQLADLQTHWQNMDFLGPMEQMFAMERALGIDAFVLVRKSYAQHRDLLNALASGPAPSVSGAKDTLVEYSKYTAWKWSWSYQEELYSLSVLQALLESCRTLKTTGTLAPAWKDYQAKLKVINQQAATVKPHFLLGMDDAIYGGCVIKSANVEIARRLLVTAIALKRYHLRHAKYPSELKLLTPEFLKTVPADLMDGKPLRYQLKPDGLFLLYSIGEDGEDNGGDATPTDKAKVYKDWLKGQDAVWPQPATSVEMEASRTNSSSKVP